MEPNRKHEVLELVRRAPVAKRHSLTALGLPRSVGDEWKFTNGRVQRVTKVEGDSVAMNNPGISTPCGDCLFWFNRNLHLEKITEPDGTAITTSKGFLPLGSGWKYWEFPLEVRKEWRISGYALANGPQRNYTIDCVVQAYEDVATKAGTFKAFKVLRVWKTIIDYRGRENSWTETVWYAPEVKTIIKYTSNNPRAADPWELASYSLK